MFTGMGLVAFCFIFGISLVGLFLGGRLPEHNRTDATQRTVQNVINILGVLSALVLGLLIAGTKTNYDTRSKEVELFAASVTLLDRELQHFGSQGQEQRDVLRAFTARKAALLWPTNRGAAPTVHDAQTVEMLDKIQAWLRESSAQTDAERASRANALQLVGELQRTSRLLAVQESSQTPPPYIFAVILWVGMLFLGHAIFAPRNTTAVIAFLVCSLSMAMAVNLIMDTDRPFMGFIRASKAPMLQALDLMKP
jgi:hypothetical protein